MVEEPVRVVTCIELWTIYINCVLRIYSGWLLACIPEQMNNATLCITVLTPFYLSPRAQKALTFFPSNPTPLSAFLFPSTESGVLGIGIPAPLLYSSKQVAW